jgi:hypothetical protein
MTLFPALPGKQVKQAQNQQQGGVKSRWSQHRQVKQGLGHRGRRSDARADCIKDFGAAAFVHGIADRLRKFVLF